MAEILIEWQLAQRRTVAGTRFVPKAHQPAAEEGQDAEAAVNAEMAAEALYRAEAEKDLDEEEELFNQEENIANPTSYNWEDKYRPRKPRYFNRVHTGYEWNKYNQTHYEYVPQSPLNPTTIFNVSFKSARTTHRPRSCKAINSISFILILSTNPKPRLSRLSKNLETTTLFFSILPLDLHTKILHLGLSIVNGSTLISGEYML